MIILHFDSLGQIDRLLQESAKALELHFSFTNPSKCTLLIQNYITVLWWKQLSMALMIISIVWYIPRDM